MFNLQQGVQKPKKVQRTSGGGLQPAQVPMRALRQRIPDKMPADGAREQTHERTSVSMRRVSASFLHKMATEGALQRAHRCSSLPMRTVLQDFREKIKSSRTPTDTRLCQKIQMPSLRKIFFHIHELRNS